METDQDKLRALGKLARARRESLQLGQEEVYEATGLSPTTQIRIEKGETVRGISYARYEAGVYWAAGSCRKFLDMGQAPVQLQPPPHIAARTITQESLVGPPNGVDRRRQATPEEHLELLRRWAETDRGLTADARDDMLAAIAIMERKLARRRGSARKRA